MHRLENNDFTVLIDERGAELVSFRSKRDDTEYIWQADPAIWKRHAPLLFPVIGRLKNGQYTAGGKAYTIPQHGFGRDLVWMLHRVSDTCAVYTLTQNEQTKAMYPWDFTCTVRYTLDGATLIKEHTTRNDSDTEMYYELGGHDGYALCLGAGERLTDHYVAFEGVDTLHPILADENVMLSQAHGALPLTDGRLYLTRETFRHDALILDDLPVRRVTVGCVKSSRRVTMDFADFPYFALWSVYKDFDVPFICLEPWSTLPDGGYLDHAIERKVGVRRLAPGGQETLTFRTTVTP